MAFIFAGLLIPRFSLAQSGDQVKTDPDKKKADDNSTKPVEPTYPKAVGYLSFILPLATLQNNTLTRESETATSIGFPTGVNVLYSSKFGFSYEFTPTIKMTNTYSKMSNLLFDPGVMFRYKHGFTFIPRLAFETSGRYGVTPVFNEVYLRTKSVNYFVAFSVPMRWGEDDGVMAPFSIGLNLQIGFIFN